MSSLILSPYALFEERSGICEPKNFAYNIPASSAGYSILPAQAGVQYIILSLTIACGANQTVIFNSTGGGSGNIHMAANIPVILPFNPIGWFRSGVGIALTAGTDVGGIVGVTGTYIERRDAA